MMVMVTTVASRKSPNSEKKEEDETSPPDSSVLSASVTRLEADDWKCDVISDGGTEGIDVGESEGGGHGGVHADG